MVKQASGYQVRKCESATCGMRYPLIASSPIGELCPRCRGLTRLVSFHERQSDGEAASQTGSFERGLARGGPELEALFDNIRSAWNVGSMLRSADGAGFRRVYLGGISPTPESLGVLKTSLGAEKAIAWTQSNDSLLLVELLKSTGRHFWALETDTNAEILYDVKVPVSPGPIVLVAGNEVCGIDPELLAQCERTLYIPMKGMKRSYNVAVAFGIAAHYLAWAASPASRSSPTGP